jgi:hypothetical protein
LGGEVTEIEPIGTGGLVSRSLESISFSGAVIEKFSVGEVVEVLPSVHVGVSNELVFVVESHSEALIGGFSDLFCSAVLLDGLDVVTSCGDIVGPEAVHFSQGVADLSLLVISAANFVWVLSIKSAASGDLIALRGVDLTT